MRLLPASVSPLDLCELPRRVGSVLWVQSSRSDENCTVCSKKIENMGFSGREPVVTGQINDDRDQFESIVERRQNMSMNGLQAVMDIQAEGWESIGTSSDSKAVLTSEVTATA